jgi:hypothetical protein
MRNILNYKKSDGNARLPLSYHKVDGAVLNRTHCPFALQYIGIQELTELHKSRITRIEAKEK